MNKNYVVKNQALLLQKTFFIFTLFAHFFTQTNQHPSGNPETKDNIVTTLFKNAQGWLLDQEENFTETDHLNAQSTTTQIAKVTINDFTIFSKPENLPLIKLRSSPYYCFSFTEHASSINLRNTPLASLFMSLQHEFTLKPNTPIIIPLTDTAHFTCEKSNKNIHCVFKDSLQ